MKKKYLWIIIAVIVVAIIAGVVIGRVMPRQITPDDLANYTEPDEYTLAGKTTISSSIPVETANLVAVTYTVRKEWIGAGTLAVGAEVKNKSTDRSIEKAEVSLKVIDSKGNELAKRSAEIFAIGSGKTETQGFGLVDLKELRNPKSFVVTLESVTWKGNVSPAPTTPPIIAEETPSQVVKSFTTAIIQERYVDAQKYLRNPSDIAGIKSDYEKNPTKKLARIAILKEEIDEQDGSAVVTCTFYLVDGSSETGNIDLQMENGEWKI